MRFYDALQLNPTDLKAQIRQAGTTKERHRYQIAMLVRAILIVLFSIALIAPLSALFGPENNAMGVSLICILLAVRFVDFGYCIQDSLRNLGIVFFLLVAGPAVAGLLPPWLGVFIHFGAFFIILTMTSEQPEMGNGGLFAFSYIFLVGNPVTGESLVKRCIMTVLCYALCGIIFYFKHRGKHEGVRYHHLAARFHLSSPKCRWQLRMALGVSLLLLLSQLFDLERFMWAGFACASLLGCYSSPDAVKERLVHRVVGAVVGSACFAVVYTVVPPQFHSLFGPLGGICLGFCTDYRYKTALNCFGALMLATGIYGLHDSVILRIINNLLGAAFGYCFCLLYRKLVDRRFENAEAAE